MHVCVVSLHLWVHALSRVRNQSNLQAKKTTNCYSDKKALSMTNKSIEIHEISLAVLTACHTRKLKEWSCAVGQRWVILYWNVKCLLAVQIWCCFKMHENCMEQRKQRVVGNGFRICMQALKYVISVVTHNTGPGHCKTGPDQGHLMPFWLSVSRTHAWKTPVVI